MAKIIFVDDETSAIKTFVSTIVDSSKVECQFFQRDYDLVLEYVKEKDIQAAFLDIYLDNFDGVQLAKEILVLRPKTKIVFVTGYSQNEEEIRQSLPEDSVLGFLYKPFSHEDLFFYMEEICKEDIIKPEIYIQTFGNFDLFINEKALYFNCAKGKELLALLVDAQGSYLNMDHLITELWGDKRPDLAKRLYRDAVCRLRKLFKENHIENLVDFRRGSCRINTELAACDYWEFLSGKGTYAGKYMHQYSWSLPKELELEELAKGQ